ncbi:MAG: hypothetical protein VX438_04625 [Planctomycetota bacterium]|nr:hypothetical protein [Planctomycetota bacterium]
MPATKIVAAATRKISRLFANELSERDPELQKTTVAAMVKTGINESDAVMQFALLQLAYKRSVEICHPTIATRVAGELDKRFEIDVWKMHLDGLKKLSRNAKSVDQLKSVLAAYEVIVQKAADNEEFAAAISMTDGMGSAARKLREPEVSKKIKNTKEYLIFSKRIHDRWQQSLGEKSGEVEMQFNRGLFLFFVKGNLDGLALIAKKKETTIGKLAAAELAQPDDKNKVAIAKGWLGWSDGLSAKSKFERKVARSHAAAILTDVVPRLKGLEKKEVENLVSKLGDISNPNDRSKGMRIEGRWSMDWESQTDWDSVEIVSASRIEVTISGKLESRDYTVESGSIAFQMMNPHRTYYLELENGALVGRIIDGRDGRLVNKGKGIPLK